ncbi:Zn(II)2Cys6 transcription factor domain-containing protein [Aspergillus glaucus CBS 516.65]|uniref:Zn(2)-C6 fungal-type domain-containing protein n=1 Tax=Aspergillus glaucus CBS 516.65 TaxID=1160497 RepID=A0A1L9VQP6_ASPGL|nr:hypothetical protein ASPGLDRAFT_1331286 [Aspergillus glaucus CBS 516.65]OJJ86222.1 hypothetical protein ASPGLDRAFT_1331286 [Aspergillus glaucus CBS 516.65]
MPPSTVKKRTRLITGCQRCRVRHFKCDTDLPACAPCKDSGTKCVRGVNVRFRNGLDLGEDHDVAFPESRIWPRLTGSSRFHFVSFPRAKLSSMHSTSMTRRSRSNGCIRTRILRQHGNRKRSPVIRARSMQAGQ